MIQVTESERENQNESSLEHSFLSEARPRGSAHYTVLRKYTSGIVESTSMLLESDEVLKTGGGGKRKNTTKEQMDELTLKKSQSRAATSVRRRCFAIGVDRLLTLTIGHHDTTIDEAWKCFKYFSRLMSWRFKDRWAYVSVPEYQKRGTPHFHCAIKGFYSVYTVRALWARATGNRKGNIDITSPRSLGRSSLHPRAIAQYISKYITKNDSVEFNQRRYSSGGFIPEPEVIRGYVKAGLSLPYVFIDIFKEFTRRNIAVMWECQEGRPLFYAST